MPARSTLGDHRATLPLRAITCAKPIADAVRTILDVCGHDVAPQYDPSKPDAIPYRMLDTTKADAVLGRRRRTSFHAGIAATVSWYRATSEVDRAA